MIWRRRDLTRSPLVLRQGEHGKSRSRITHKAPGIGGHVSPLVYRGSRPEAFRHILVAHQPGESTLELDIVARHTRFLQGKGNEAGRDTVTLAFYRCPVFPEPHVCE